MKPHEVKLHRQLAEIGLERTPAEIKDIIVTVGQLIEFMNEELYLWFKHMTPGRILVEAGRRSIPLHEFIKIREMIILLYEYTRNKESL